MFFIDIDRLKNGCWPTLRVKSRNFPNLFSEEALNLYYYIETSLFMDDLRFTVV